jgi:hypothetical protein
MTCTVPTAKSKIGREVWGHLPPRASLGEGLLAAPTMKGKTSALSRARNGPTAPSAQIPPFTVQNYICKRDSTAAFDKYRRGSTQLAPGPLTAPSRVEPVAVPIRWPFSA